MEDIRCETGIGMDQVSEGIAVGLGIIQQQEQPWDHLERRWEKSNFRNLPGDKSRSLGSCTRGILRAKKGLGL